MAKEDQKNQQTQQAERNAPPKTSPDRPSDKREVAQKGAEKTDDPKDRNYGEKSVQQRMDRPTPQQQRTAGREGGEDIEGQTPTDRYQGQGSSNQGSI